MVVRKPTIAMIGAGRVGSAFASLLATRGYPLVGVGSRTEQSAARLGKKLGVSWSTEVAEITRKAEVVFICTPDSKIETVVREIAKAQGVQAGQYVFHTSGALSLEPLAAAAELGALTGSLHPLQSFANDSGQGLLNGTYFAIDGDRDVIALARSIVADLGGIAFTVPSGERARYHSAACMASNYLVALLHGAATLLGGCGLSEREALQALLPLLQGTLANVTRLGTSDALTGPIRRGDAGTVAEHIEALQGNDRKILRLYKELGLYTMRIAGEREDFNRETSAELLALLQHNTGRNEHES